MKKKVENFFRRLLSMVLSICMLLSNVGSMGIALAETSLVSESTGPLIDYVDYNGQNISTTLDLTYVGSSNYMYENGAYTDYADMMAWYYVDVSVSQYVASIDVTLSSGASLDGTGNPAVFLFRGNNASSIDMNTGLGHGGDSYSISATKNGNDVLLHAENKSGTGWSMPTGYYRFYVGVPMSDASVVDMLNNGSSVTHTVGSLKVNDVASASTQTRSNSVALQANATMTAKQVNANVNNSYGVYVRYQMDYTANFKMRNTTLTATLDRPATAFVTDWKTSIGGENAIQAYEGSYAVAGGEQFSNNNHTVTFNVTGTNEQSNYTDLRYKMDTELKLVFFAQMTGPAERRDPSVVTTSYSLAPNGYTDASIDGKLNTKGSVKTVTVQLMRAENGAEPVAITSSNQNLNMYVLMTDEAESVKGALTKVEGFNHSGNGSVNVSYNAEADQVKVTPYQNDLNADRIYGNGDTVYLDANNNNNSTEAVDRFTVEIVDNGGEATVRLVNYVTIIPINVVLKQSNATTGEVTDVEYTGNNATKLYAVVMDDEGNAVTPVVQLSATIANNQLSYNGELSTNLTEGYHVALLTSKDGNNHTEYSADNFNLHDGLTEDTKTVDVNMDNQNAIGVCETFAVTSEADETTGGLLFTLVNEIETIPTTIKIETYDETTGAYSAVTPNANNFNLYLAYFDAEGNCISDVVKPESAGTGLYTAELIIPAGAEGAVNLLTVKSQKSYNAVYSEDIYERYYNGKLTNTSVFIDIDGGTVSLDEYFGATFTRDENGALVHLVNDRASALQGLVDAYKGGELEINENTGAFSNYDGGKYFNSSSPIGIAGSFHLVAFEDAYLNAHTNGNVLANRLHAFNNFGTNNYPYELSYVKDYVVVHESSASKEEHILALGAGNELAVSENGSSLNIGVNGVRISKPKNVIIDKDETHPFIDLAAVESQVRAQSGALASNSENVGISEDFSGSQKKLVLTSSTGAGYYNMSAQTLMNMGTDLRLCFTDQNSGSIVINVDCSGVSEINMPERALVNINGQDQGTSEVTTFENGKVIWNFYNAEGKTINAKQMTGMILAPGATVNLLANVNGTVVADVINVKAESHRTDFTGTTSPASGVFSAVKKVNGKTPSSDEKFWFVLEQLNSDNTTWTEVQRVQNNGSKIQFSNITYTTAGTRTYRIRELDLDVPDGYTISGEVYYMQVEVYSSSVLGNTALGKKYTFWKENQSLPNNEAFVFNNSKETVDLTLVKKDAENGDLYLEGAVFQLTGPNGYSATVTTNNLGHASFMNMPDGEYTLTEVTAPTGYELPTPNVWTFTKSGESFSMGTFENASLTDAAELTVLNEKEEKITISGSKTWNDNNNLNNNRPESITVVLYANGNQVDSKEVTSANNWSWSFPDLPTVDENGTELTYTIGEISVPGYTTRVDGTNLINTPELLTIEGEKIWTGDGSVSALTRPDSVTIRIWDGETEVANTTATADKNWKYSVTGLPKYRDGQLITYTVTEDAVPGYTTTVNNYNVENTLETTTFEGEKKWEDSNNAYQLRPASITVVLKKTVNGTTSTVKETTVDNSTAWVYSFTGLPTKEKVGTEFYPVTYSVDEVAVPGYTCTKSGDDLINTLDTVDVNGTKEWKNDQDNAYSTRPESITILLYQNEVYFDSTTTTEAEGWNWSFTGLPECNSLGIAYEYTVSESPVNGYETSVDQDARKITNTLLTTSLSGVKNWVDQDDYYGLRPSEVTIQVYNGETLVTSTVAKAENGWAWSVSGLPKFDPASGNQINYSLAEIPSTGYTAYIDGTSVENHLDTVTLSGTKTWVDDAAYAELTRPESITVKAMNGTTVVKTVEVTPVNGDWSWSITDLPKYDAEGNEITYTVAEDVVIGYTTEAILYNEETGKYDITNTLLTTEVAVEKIWTDNNNNEETRPASVTVQLMAGTENFGDPITLSDEAGWSYTWAKLPKVDENGTAITYDVAEINVPDGYVSVKSGNATSFTFENIYVFDTSITLEAEKELQGATMTAGLFTFQLKDANGNVVDEAVNAADGSVTFASIPFTKDDLGDHTYTISEVNAGVNGYSYSTDVYTVKVTVAQDATTKQLSATAEYSKEGTVVAADEVKFVNTYDADDATIAIPFAKTFANGEKNTIDRTFTFSLAKPDGTSETKTLTVAKGATSASGSFSVLTFNAEGTYTYTVTETAGTDADVVYDSSSYTVVVSVVDNGGELEASITSVNGAADGVIAFTNTYVEPVKASLEARKILNGPNALEDKQFTFLLKKGTEVVQTQTNDANGVVAFDPITYGAAGTYTYTISEVKGTVGGYTYDEAVYEAVVTVTQDAATKQLSTSVAYTNLSDGTTVPTFVNTYTPNPDLITIPVQKHYVVAENLNGPDITGKFTFTITGEILAGEAESVPLPSPVAIKNTSDTVYFNAITFDKAGTYEYTIAESGNVPGVTNDTTGAKKVTVVVTDDKNGNLTAAFADETFTKVEFTNTYTVGEVKLSIPVKKVLTVPEGQEGTDITRKFTFTLDTTSGAPLPGTKIIVNPDADGGTASFGEITFTEPGNYVYTVTETVTGGGSVPGVTMDAESTKQVVVTVEDTSNGNLVIASCTSTDENPLTFTNVYNATPAEASIPVTKLLELGDGLTNPGIANAFNFTITGAVAAGTATEAPLPDVKSITNPEADGGNMTFGPISFSKVGTYVYTITETGSQAGVTPVSAQTAQATVVVTDDGKGNLVATLTDCSETAPVTFVNEYNVEPTTAQIPVEKVLKVQSGEGPEDVTGKFTFLLKAITPDAPMPKDAYDNTVSSLTNAAAGEVATFATFTFTKPGDYKYSITETGTVPGVENDVQSVRYVIISVTDKGDGTMEAEVQLGDDDAVIYTNTYNAKPVSYSIPVEKELIVGEGLTNAPDITGKYTFAITGTNVPMPEVTSVVNDEGVDMVFGPIEYTAVGTYTYTITETGEVQGVQNDGSKTVTVVVKDDKQGNLYIDTEATTVSETKPVKFENTYTVGEANISFTAEKTLKVPANLEGADITGLFTFTLAADESNPAGYTMPDELSLTNPNANGGSVTFGKITFTKPGDYKFTITESGNVSYIENDATAVREITVTVVDNGNGTMTATADIANNTVSFENTYKVTPTSVTLPVEKTLTAVQEGLPLPNISGLFSFTITGKAVDADNNEIAGAIVPMPAVTTLTYTEVEGVAQPMAFENISYSTEGTYIYTITESGTVNGVTNDGEKTVKVVVEDNNNGTLTATVTGLTDDKLTFENTYNVGPVEVTFPVEKVLEIPEGLTGPATIKDLFTFTLSRNEANADAPMPETTSYKTPDADGGKVTFGPIEYTTPGDYVYDITETGTVDGIKNDATATKTVTVHVVANSDGTMTATASSTDAAPLTFTNKYGVEPTKTSFPVEKILSVPAGLDAADITGKFTFTLTAADGVPMPETVSYLNPDADGGVVTFGEIDYTAPGIYTYTVTETGSADGVTNDATAAKTVTVTVVDNGDGTLTATPSSTEQNPLTFTNTYSADDASATIFVEKVLEVPAGLDANSIAEKFTFTLTADEGTPMPEVVEKKNSDADGGVISFGPILYNAPGIYTYTVTESGSADGVTNDSVTAKEVTVTVADNGAGKLVATVTVTEESPLTFTNEYDVLPTTASFPVKKIIVVPEGLNADSAAGKFTFTLTAGEGVPMPETTSYTNPTAEGGSVTFGDIEYTEPGTYVYTVIESGTVPGFTNDVNATRTVTVTVVDNGDGTLTATADSTDANPATFTNTYGVKPTSISFPVEKILEVPTGLTAPDITGLFSFTLSAADGTPIPDTIRYTTPEADGGVVSFGPIEYTAPGTYTYTITEGGSADGVTNDATAEKTVTVTVVDNGNGTLTATATSTEQNKLTFTNTYGVEPTEISIPVEKVLEVPTGLTAGDITGKFTFTLTGEALDADGNAIEGAIVPMPAVTSYTNPDADGGSVTFGDIEYAGPGTYLYTITETGSAAGVTNDATASKTVKVVVVDNINGTLTATVTGLTDGKLTFTNTYGVEPTTASFPVVKTLEVPAGLTAPSIAGQFTFTVEAITAGAPMPTVTSKTNPAANGGTMVFEGMSYTMPGKYEYKVTETGSVPGVSNVTTTEQKVTVNVVDNNDGTLTATVSSTEAAPLTFVNKYEVGKTTVSFPVKKVVSKADSSLTPADMTGKFTFTLTAAPGVPMPETTVYTNPSADGGTVTFGTIEYTDPGTYTYTVTETGSADGVTNDTTTAKTVTVTVTDNGNGTMTAVATSTTESPLTFTNGYSVEPTTASFPVEKILSVPDGLTADDITGKFTFTLATTNGAPMPEVTSAVNPDADGGVVTFGTMSYSLPGTYKYTVTESVTPDCEVPGITNDAQATKEVTVTVVDNGDGTLTATASSTEAAPLTFTNSYDVEGTTVTFPVEKVLNVPAGLTADSIANKFTFTVTAADGTPMPAVTSYTNPDADGGSVTFGPISYSAPGTYTYTVTETGSAAGVTNDATAAKTVTVTVVDNGDGTLTATASSTTASPLTFTNDYDVQPTTASFPVEKILEVPAGLTAGDITGKFIFTLTAASGVPMPTVTSYQNPDADGGVVTFGTITYTAPGTYVYTVTETGSADGVTNDATAAKTVTVTVVDNGDGTLTATPTSTEESKLTFTNTYGVEPTKASIPVEKVINVPAGLTAGDVTGKFTFTLTGANGAPMPAVTSYTNPDADGGKVSFGEITFNAPGTYNYTVTETGSADGITNDATAQKPVTVTVVDNGDGTLTATVSSTDAAPLTFTNDYNVGSTSVAFPVKKVLSVPAGLSAGSIAGKFTFTLTAAEGTPMPTVTSHQNPDADGGVVTFGNILYSAPGTYVYTITETGSADGVTNDSVTAKTVTVTVVDNGDGTLSATATSTAQNPLTFTNDYSVQPTTASFPVEKILEVPEGLTAGDITGKFTFTVTAEDGVPMPAVTSYQNPDADGGVVTFGTISYSAPGTYVYTVTETGSADGVTNDATAEKTVTVTVVDNGDGTLTATADSTTESPLAFTNTYDVEPTTAKFPVKKTLNVPAGLTAGSIAGKFTFTLTAAEGTPMPEVTSYTNPGVKGGTVTFGDITYTEPGTYVYTVTESGSVEGVVNDATASKPVTVTVVDNGDGTLTATADSTAQSPLTFTNDYKVGSTSASFPVKKVLSVPAGLTAGDITGKFTFTLTAAEGTPMPAVTSFTNPDADGGLVSFGAIEYTAPGTYTYTITETGSADGVTNDATASKTVTVTVVDNGDGTLSATATSTVESPLTFTNDYSVQPTTASFPVEKILEVPEGLTAGDITGKFTFTVTAAEGTPMPETTSYTNPDADGGVVTFGTIEYTMPGTYVYTVTETGSADGVTNDATSAKTVTVTVVDNGNGTLTATADSTADSPLTFTNGYDVEPTTASFPVEKILTVPEGLTAGDVTGKFTFTLTAVNGSPMPEITAYTNPNADGGSVTFGPISYTAPGTYSYTVTETGSADGVINDATSAKTVTVTVVDNGDGTLTATADSTAQSPLTFTNGYDVEPTTASFPVEKVLEVPEGLNAGSIAGKFTFTLTADEGIPMPEVTSYTNPYADGGVVTFGTIEYDAPGTYVYTVTETGSADGVTNDATAAKTVTVTVVDNGDGSLTATADSTVQNPLTFTNDYSVQPTTASFPVEKILTVPEGLTAGDITGKFTFTVTAESGVPMPETTSYTNPDADGGVVTFGAITYTAPGTYVYTITETGSADGITNDATAEKTVTVTVVDNGDGTLTATADSTADSPLTFTNGYDVEPTTASFPVEKILTVPEGLTAGDITGKFGFVLAAVDGAPMPETTSYQNPDADGGMVTFGPISYSAPGTYSYTVTETGSADGVTNDATATKNVTVTVVDNGDGTLTATASSTTDAPLTFTNDYDVAPTTVSFPVEKVLEVPEGLTANSIAGKFTFTLTADEGVPMPETTSYTNPDADGGEVTFGTIEYTEPGTYVYTVTETGSADGVTNDATAAKTVTVTVVDNGDGTLTATADSTTENPLTFTNGYSVEPTTASFPVEKILEVPEGLTANSIAGLFTFTVTADSGVPMPETTSYTNPDADGGVVTFGTIEYTMPGEYTYTITETGSAAGVTNDAQAAKSVVVTVVDNGDGTLTATADSTTESPLTFTNSYSVEPTTASFPVKKLLTKADESLTAPDITGVYTFTLTAEDGIPMPETTSYTNPDADGGEVTFGEIEYTMPGTYVYTITETGVVSGVVNDAQASKTVTVTVVDNGDGTLTATADSNVTTTLTFTNNYEVAPTTASIPMEKVVTKADESLTPADMTGKFTFTLTAAEGVPMPETTSYTNPDADGGSVTFGTIEYTVPGTYVYTITETGDVAGVTNDAEAAKTVTVEVVDNGDGTLSATVSSTEENKLTFTNAYSVEPIKASFPVEKVLLVDEGDTAPDITGLFTFELTAENGAPVPDTIRYTTPAANGGTVTFGDIEYTKPGTYVYTITETGVVSGIINDVETTKTVTVNVVDNGDGTLTATLSSTADAPLTFTNSYEVVDISVLKVWDDDNNRDGYRPESIQVQLMADGTAKGEPVTLNDENGWKHIWEELPRYATTKTDSQITYEVVEVVDDLTAEKYDIVVDAVWDAEANGEVTITNTHVPEVVQISGSKTWDDIDNRYLKRPESVTIRLYEDGVEVASKQVTEADNWSWTFTDMPKYKIGAVGQLINYTIDEDVVTGYITTVDEYNVTNSLNLVEFIKLDEQTGKRLPGAKFALYEGRLGTYDENEPIETWTSTKDAKVLAGLKVGQTYTIVETYAPSGYAAMKPFQFTVELSDIPGTFRAFSASNCHVYRFRKLDSSNGATVHGAHMAIMFNGSVVHGWYSSGDNGGWFEVADHTLTAGVNYQLVELESPWGYELADPIPFTIDAEDGMLVVNGRKTYSADLVMYDEPWPEVTPTPEPTETSFSVTKIWEDQDNVLGLRPNSITVHLYRKLRTDNEYPTTPFMTVNINNNGRNEWKFTFNNLPRRSEEGVLYEYCVLEDEVDGYVVAYRNNGRTIINSIPEEDYPPTPTPTLPYVTPTPTAMPRVPAGVQFIDGEWVYVDEYGIPLGGIPLTGDNTNFILWGMAVGLPMLVAALAAVEIRRRKKLLLAVEDEEEEETTEE